MKVASATRRWRDAVMSGSPRASSEQCLLLQEVTAPLPGPMHAGSPTFSTELARAAAARGEHAKRTGQQAADWPD